MHEAGTVLFGPDFHLSHTLNSSLRPFFVKDSTRETCNAPTAPMHCLEHDCLLVSGLCIYHLKMVQAAEDLANFRTSLRSNGTCTCKTPTLRNSRDLWHVVFCDKPEDSLVYKWDCVNNVCGDCGAGKRLLTHVLCPCITDTSQPRIKWKTYDQIDTGKERVAREDGSVTKVFRHDFVARTDGASESTPLQDYIDYFTKELWPEFSAHHDLALWQDYDWQHQRNNQPLYTVVTVEDFPENFTHLFKREPQSPCRKACSYVENDRRDEDAEVRSDLVLAHFDSNLGFLSSHPEQ